ncbi:alanine/glycine:cation symporter family protein [Georgenia sp. 10Sc9-8]|uniref:Alanine/glycine:cation symporter family protein n=1 Tax=Georgenia halotolerans TaxID=3028317 RepID=A0ABT5U1A8_9MICO|nr:alanine/glycine:cation symporter family protein [Georgenia halotolerans]
MNDVLGEISNVLYTYLLIGLLVGVGLYFTIRTRVLQVRLFRRMLGAIFASRSGQEGGISSFQAFAIGLGARVGTGNIAGVALALTLGGPGAIFWMWMVAVVGMATAFVESTLAQMYKIRWRDGTFRGGPAFYIQRGLGSRAWGTVFAGLIVFAFGFSFQMVHANTFATTLEAGHGVPTWVGGLVLLAATAPVVLGGVRRVARIAELLAPAMAILYIVVAIVVAILHIDQLPAVLGQIVRGAFGLDEALAGTGGGLIAALLNGARRGLFSNEAGMGSAPNAASTATVAHPAQQGLVQSLGVFIDTIIVCSVTAFLILLAGPAVYSPGEEPDVTGAGLTQAAVVDHLGGWSAWPMTILVAVFVYTSVLGAFTYAEVNMDFLTRRRWANTALRLVVVTSVFIGSISELLTVWALADIAMALMTLVNLVAIVLLGRWAVGAMRDFEKYARGTGMREMPGFEGTGNPDLPGDIPGDLWDDRDNVPVSPRG